MFLRVAIVTLAIMIIINQFSNHGEEFDSFTISLRYDFIAFGSALTLMLALLGKLLNL
jgi:hypothetical protein